jgi:hypothetical protein
VWKGRGPYLYIWVLALLSATVGCRAQIQSTLKAPPTPAQMAELWVDPGRNRDLFWGVGGRALAPDPAARYTVIEMKRGGFSRG